MVTTGVAAAAAELRGAIDEELAMLAACLEALGGSRARTPRRCPPPGGGDEPGRFGGAFVKGEKRVVKFKGDGMAILKSKRRGPGRPRTLAPGQPKPKDGRCDVCGRADIELSAGGVVPFHYAPDPCGLVCAGGGSIGKPEDRVDGVHSRRNCPKCNAPAQEATA